MLATPTLASVCTYLSTMIIFPSISHLFLSVTHSHDQTTDSSYWGSSCHTSHNTSGLYADALATVYHLGSFCSAPPAGPAHLPISWSCPRVDLTLLVVVTSMGSPVLRGCWGSLRSVSSGRASLSCKSLSWWKIQNQQRLDDTVD